MSDRGSQTTGQCSDTGERYWFQNDPVSSVQTAYATDTPAEAAARAWLHSYGINTSRYVDGGGDHPAMRTLPRAFEEFARSVKVTSDVA